MNKLPASPADTAYTPAPGVFRIAAPQVRPLIDAAERSDYCTRTVDLCGARDKQDLLARIATALDFPEWFGHNWDALADCLGDLAWLPPRAGYVFVLHGCSGHEETMPILYEILEQACTDWQERGILMAVFIALPEAQA